VSRFRRSKILTNGAYGIFKEDEIGILKPGFAADFLVLSSDPLRALDFKMIEVYHGGQFISK